MAKRKLAQLEACAFEHDGSAFAHAPYGAGDAAPTLPAEAGFYVAVREVLRDETAAAASVRYLGPFDNREIAQAIMTSALYFGAARMEQRSLSASSASTQYLRQRAGGGFMELETQGLLSPA